MKNVIKIFVNTTKDYEIWNIDESFRKHIRQIIEDKRNGVTSQEEEYSRIYEVLKHHGRCIAKNIDFGIKVKSDEDEDEKADPIYMCKKHDEILTKLIDRHQKT